MVSNNNLWQGKIDPTGADALKEVIRRLEIMQMRQDKQIAEYEKRQQESELRIQKLFNAFPEGDTDGHAQYHDSLIRATEARRQLYKAIVEKTLTGLIWLFILYIGSVFLRETSHFLAMFNAQPPEARQ